MWVTAVKVGGGEGLGVESLIGREAITCSGPVR